MRVESNLGTTEAMSSNTAEAAAVKTVSNRFQAIGEKAKSVTRMVTQRAVLTGGVLALLVSSGCSNSEQPNTPTPAEPTPISSPIAETVRTPEKQALTDVEFVSDLLRTYLDLDADPRLKRLEDRNLLNQELTKRFYDDLSYRQNSQDGLFKAVPLGKFEPISGLNQIKYEIPSVKLTITLAPMTEGRAMTSIGFSLDEAGMTISAEDPRLTQNKPFPAKEELSTIVLSGTENLTRLLNFKPKPIDWTVGQTGFSGALIVMNANVKLSDGKRIRYSVGSTGERPLDVFLTIES